MSKSIRIEIPGKVHKDDWAKHLQERIGELQKALDLSAGVAPNDHRVNVNQIKIDSIKIGEEDVLIYYSYSRSAHHGCPDQDAGGDEDDYVCAKRYGNVLLFQPHTNIKPRTTLDEY